MTDLRRLAFIDVETTGLDPATDRVAEIGVVTVDGDSMTEWGTFIARKRGAEPRAPRANVGADSLLALPDTAPTFGDIATELERRLAGRLFIAHNARFDYAFVKAEFERAGIAFEAPVLCTVMLSRRLYPRQTAHDLDTLIDRHGLVAVDRHRALPDARALAACWFAIERDKGREALAGVVPELLAGPVLPAHLDPGIISRLPESSGVYVFQGCAREVLRIGVARNLRAHLESYFRLDRASPRALAISHKIETITWRTAQGMLGARLQAIALANAAHPRGKSRQARALSWRANPDCRPCIELVAIETESLSGGNDLFGMFDSERKARNALLRLSRRHSLCHAMLGIPLSRGVRCSACDDGGRACGVRTQRLRHLVECFVALRSLRIAPWPFPGPIVVRERRDLHVFDDWRHLGTMNTESEVLEATTSARPGDFDEAVYACLLRSVARIPADRIRPLQSRASTSICRNVSRRSKMEKADTTCRPLRIPGGDEEDRTPDLRIANAALSQLSYVPEAKKYSRSGTPA